MVFRRLQTATEPGSEIIGFGSLRNLMASHVSEIDCWNASFESPFVEAARIIGAEMDGNGWLFHLSNSPTPLVEK